MLRKRIRNPLSDTKASTDFLGKPRERVRWNTMIMPLAGMLCCLGVLFFLLLDDSQSHAALHDLSNNVEETASGESQARTLTVRMDTVQSVRNEFYRRYGGQTEARALYNRGIQAFGSVEATAHRLLQSAATKSPFVLSFAGYSVTVGRGNYYNQSYPFVLGRILQPLIQNVFQIDVTVRNAAIGGIPSYPYAFCFEHFLGTDPHVISWDFSMNEGRGAAVLESYLRQSQHQLPKRPLMIVLDTDKGRCSLLSSYAQLGLISDALCVGRAKDAVINQTVLSEDIPDSAKPVGYQHWNEFGAPQGCPGRGNWHPKRMEHELIGWMLAMYFAEAVEEAQKIVSHDPKWQGTYRQLAKDETPVMAFPKTLTAAKKMPDNAPAVNHVLFGHLLPSSSDHQQKPDSELYSLKHISCRTNFLPATDHEKVIPSVVVSGLASSATADNIMEERSDETYRNGWVLDVSHVERTTKVKVEKCGGLGYVDLKTSLYGIPESGLLRLWLPSMTAEISHDDHDHDFQDDASHWFNELIFCEANEKRGDEACKLDQDLEFIVGGVLAKSPTMIAGAGEYLKRKTCVHVGVPEGAKITPVQAISDPQGNAISKKEQDRLLNSAFASNPPSSNPPGLLVDLRVRPKVTRKDGACCVSHIVWEEH